MKNKKKIVIPVLFVCVLAVVLIFLIKKDSGNSKNIKGSGTIEVTEINVASKITGRITKISTDEGNNVVKNQMLVKIEADEVSGKLEEAQAVFHQSNQALSSAQAVLSNTISDLRRLEALYKAGSIPKMQLDTQKTKYLSHLSNYRSALAGVNRAKSALSIAKFYAKEYLVSSPITGTVLKKYFEEGELVMPGSILLSCADLKDVYLKIYIPEYKLGIIKLGQRTGEACIRG
jgi:HlyD family secretion protein